MIYHHLLSDIRSQLPKNHISSTYTKHTTSFSPPRATAVHHVGPPAVRQVEGRKGDQDAAAHHKSQRRIPVARHVQEVEHLGLEGGKQTWKDHRKTIGKPSENAGLMDLYV